jgi:hypothetical protein
LPAQSVSAQSMALSPSLSMRSVQTSVRSSIV